MIEVFTYPDYSEYDESFPQAVEAEKARLLIRLARKSISYMELVCLPSDDEPLSSRDVIDTAIAQLEQSGQIVKDNDVEPTFHQNLVITYKVAS